VAARGVRVSVVRPPQFHDQDKQGLVTYLIDLAREKGVPLRDIAQVIGRRLNVPVVAKSPEEAANHFGWLAVFVSGDALASSALKQERLGWRPVQPGLIPDLERARNLEF